jgi:hypothetical protein
MIDNKRFVFVFVFVVFVVVVVVVVRILIAPLVSSNPSSFFCVLPV